MKRQRTIILALAAHIGFICLMTYMGGCAFRSSKDTLVSPYRVRIPDKFPEPIAPSEDMFQDESFVRNELEIWEPAATGSVEHVVKKGETLYSIGRKYGVSVNELVAANNITSRNTIAIGQVLRIPVSGSGSDGVPKAVPQVTGTPEPYVQEEITLPAMAFETLTTHEVQKGDTIYSIARTYGVSPKRIMEVNGLGQTQSLREGQTVQIPTE